MSRSALSAATFLVLVAMVSCWPSGAPEQACESLTPKHGNNSPKPASAAPFALSQTTDNFQPGDKVAVTVRGSPGTPFKGLMIQAYDPNTSELIGRFEAGRGLKLLDSCAAVTHSDRRGKRSATLVWEAPLNRQGRVAFRATVVQRFSEYYTGLESALERGTAAA